MLNFDVKVLNALHILAVMIKFLLLAYNSLVHHENEIRSITMSVLLSFGKQNRQLTLKQADLSSGVRRQAVGLGKRIRKKREATKEKPSPRKKRK